MKFESLRWKNLFSYGEEEQYLDLSQNGTIFIRGVNKDTETSNGSGKSSIIDIFVWTLYGKPLKNIPVDKVENVFSKGGGEATIEFYVGSDHYAITRYRNHKKYSNSVIFTKNGLQIEGGTNRDIQKRINDVLGLDYHSFVSSFTFTSEVEFEFPLMSPQRRREFLEQLLGMQLFSEYGKTAKSMYKNIIQNLEVIENSLSVTKGFLKSEKDDYVKFLEKHKNFDVEKKETLEKLEAELEELTLITESYDVEYISKLENSISEKNKKLSEISDEINSVKLDLTENKSSLKEISRKIQNLEKEKEREISFIERDANKEINSLKKRLKLIHSECPTCNRGWSPQEVSKISREIEDKISEIENSANSKISAIEEESEEEISALRKQYGRIKKEIEELTSKLDSLENTYKEETENLKDMETEFSKYPSESDIVRYDSRRQMILTNIENIKKETSPYKEVLLKTKNKIEELIEKIEELKKEKKKNESDLKYVSFWNESLNNGGLKIFMFETVVPVLNQFINQYIPFFFNDKNVEIRFDKFLNMEVIKEGCELSYGSLSKGERKRVDLILSLALLETAQTQHGISSNVMFFDEIFDGSLDSEGVKAVIEILNSMPFETIFVISHRLEIISEFDNIIEVVKEGKISRILVS